MTQPRFDTAHERWNRWWDDAKHRARWNEPEPAVIELIPVLRGRSATRVLDIGTGIGRHALALARAGFEVVAVDASPIGVDRLIRAARAEGLDIDTQVASFAALPLPDAAVDHVLAWTVLYHGDGDIVRAAFGECRRVLRSDGSCQLTMLSKRHRSFGVGREVRPDTFMYERSMGDKDHPHFYVDAPGLTAMLADVGFDVVSLIDVDQQPPDGFHWVVTAEVR
jgi:tellurite methyltransferase